MSPYRFEDLRAGVAVPREFGFDVVAGLGAALAGVGPAGEAARVHDRGRSGGPPGVVLKEGKYLISTARVWEYVRYSI